MPQVVPSMGYYNPLPNYTSSFAAESFDLSLLPDDCAVPGSPEADLFSCLADGGACPQFLYDHQGIFELDKGYLKEEPLSPPNSYVDSTCSSPSQRCPSPVLDAVLGSPEPAAVPLKVEPRVGSSLMELLQEPPVRTQDELNALLQAPLKRSAMDTGLFEHDATARKRCKEEPMLVGQQPLLVDVCNIKQVRDRDKAFFFWHLACQWP
jgi:hypothetical protein